MKHSSLKLTWYRLILSILTLLMALSLAGCDVLLGGETSLESTKTAVSLQQTQLAMQNNGLSLTAEAQKATLDAQATQIALPATPTPPVQPQATAPAQPTSANSPTQPPPTAPPMPVATEAQDLSTLMKSASILLYEDMVNHPETNRYVKDTLDYMDLRYKDDGSAKGWLKSDLLAGAPTGQPWDLVIIAAEAKSGVQGEFFEYVNDALGRGSSVILEVWYLDQTYTGTASSLLARCGIQFQSDWTRVPPSRMVMFPLDATHPVMLEPNAGLTFTDVTSFWWDPNGTIDYDIGDLVRLTNDSQARLLVGTIATEVNSHGTVTVCMDGRLTLQTFSSHQLTFDSMRPVWENYIYNALKVRLLGGS